MLDLERDLAPDERDRILDRVAREVTGRRLEVPAVLALEMHRPLAFLGSQVVVLFTPLLGPAFGLANLQSLARLLEDPQNLDRLLDRIEELARERDAASTAAHKETPDPGVETEVSGRASGPEAGALPAPDGARDTDEPTR